jgi:hypothetical protein
MTGIASDIYSQSDMPYNCCGDPVIKVENEKKEPDYSVTVKP